MGQWLDSITGWLTLNPQWLAAAVFIVACVECLAIAGLIVPGTVLLFGVAVLAGSGALFLEALSRGAASGVALDSSRAAIENLKDNLELLRCPTGQVIQTDVVRYLQGEPKAPFDVVFLDPPFHQDLLANTCNLLEQNQWLREQAWVYTESETAPSAMQMPGNWRLHREKKAGQVHYALWERG